MTDKRPASAWKAHKLGLCGNECWYCANEGDGAGRFKKMLRRVKKRVGYGKKKKH